MMTFRYALSALLVPMALSGSTRADELLPTPRPLPSASPANAPRVTASPVLHPGETVTLRIRQVIPCDGLSTGERLLNSLPPLQPGDQFLAELMVPPGEPTSLIGGDVTAVTLPGKFGRPGRVSLQLAQVVHQMNPQSPQWQFNIEDQRITAKQRRLLTTLFVLEGLGVGASIGAQFDRGAGAVGAGAAAGMLLGIAYASLQPGREASLEPGDTFRVVVGACSVKVLPPDNPLTLYPAQDLTRRKGKP